MTQKASFSPSTQARFPPSPQARFPLTTAVCEISDPCHWNQEKLNLFYQSCKEMAQFHYQNNAVIRALYDQYQFNPSSIASEADLEKIPALGVTAMKYHLFTSMNENESVLRLTSSGTRGQKTQVLFDQGSLDRVQRMMDVYFEQEGFVSSESNNYFIFNYDPDDAGDLGIAYTEKNQMRFAPIADSYFAIKKNARGDWEFNKQKAYDTLLRYSQSSHPVRLFAMPAFLFEFVQWMREENLPALKFSAESWIMTGGGWKAAEDKKITREQFRVLCLETFNIPLERQRDAFGMAEHCAPYFECSEHRLHVPVFNRVIIRDPVSFEPVANGKAGLMELITSFNAMMPSLAILTTDYGRLRAEPCECGFQSPTFEIIGRAGLSKHKGCALTASEIVRRV
jgi:phenylacetate-coenzyme A ligase PaaK-like adenylate-forming protein